MAYSYSSYASGGYGGDAFSQADLNQDGVVDRGEFQNFVAGNTGGLVGAVGYGGASGYEAAALGGVGFAGASGYEAAALGGVGFAGGASAFESEYASEAIGGGAGIAVGGAYGVSGAAYGASSAAYATDAQGLFQDPNPVVVRRPAPGGAATYTQNIRVRFLQPPPVPPPGPIVIKEVRPPQPPPPPPLRLRQQAPPLPTPPPLILRERPPVPPPVLPGKTIVRPLPPIPVPPRSVIIERLPPLPPRPRDIVIERWLQYGPQAKQRTIVQPAPPPVRYQAPRNIIIQYDQVAARVVRQFQNLGVTAYSPAQYVQQYGASLLDAGTLVAQARAAGIVEDISPPGVVGASAAAVGFGGAVYGQGAAAFESGVVGGGYGFGGGLAVGGGYAEDVVVGGGLVGGGGFVAGGYGGGLLGNVADAAFSAGDLDRNGALDRAEFNNLVTGGGIDGRLSTPW